MHIAFVIISPFLYNTNINKSNMEENKPRIAEPPRQIFDNPNISIEEKAATSENTFDMERVEIDHEKGIRIFYKGVLFPTKGWPFQSAMYLINIVKRQTMMLMSGFGNKEIIFSALGFLLTPYSWKIRIIENLLVSYNRNANFLLSNIYLKNEYMQPCSRELMKIIDRFLLKMGISQITRKETAKIFATMIEYDDAYRYRIEDIFSETTKESLIQSPRKEIKRLVGIYSSRETKSPQIIAKFKSFSGIFSLILLNRKIKQAFLFAIAYCEFSNLQLDEGDRYHCGRRNDYDFFGDKFEDRYKKWIDMHNGNLPPLIKKGTMQELEKDYKKNKENIN